SEQASPFVYEKTGTRIISYMIDEFQDTSGMQWENFSPLLRDSLANGSRDLIVGDVKQSIYRWRGSDWELLHSRLDTFEPDKQAIDENGNQLRDNWRSDLKIIRFNNQFFQFASQRFSAMEGDDEALAKITQIYADVEQTVSPARKKVADGTVTHEVLAGKENSAEYKASVTQRLPELVIALQQRGYTAGDILILCRKRDQCSLCAKALMDYRAAHPQSPYSMEIITAEALQLTNQRVIHALVAALEFLHDPKSDYRRAVASVCWLALSVGSVANAISAHFAGQSTPDFEQLQNLPLYETVERLIAMLPAQARREGNFIQAFCDVVLDFCAKEGPSLDSFLSWWRDNGKKCNVTTPTQQNAIRIMTIHQSKGLAGEAVIVPFAQETLDININGMAPDLLWCEPQVEPFRHDDLVVPIEVGKMMKQSIFRPDFDAERIRAIIDNLNTAYVAFTRAKHALIILSPTPPDKPNASLQSFLTTFFADEWEEPMDKFVADDITPVLADAPLATTPTESDDSAADAPTEIRLPLIKQTAYVPPSDSAAARGTTLHAALSAITDHDHIDEPVTRLFQSGQARLQGGMTLADVLQYVHNALQLPEARPWFDPHNRALNEQDIITRSTHTQRPDRVVFTPDGRAIVIDYKTGEERNRLYSRQVGHYMALLSQMGFQRIEGYLWYIETGRIVPVRV
ncbi:MAG: UvrD-helicase domain-containing protein, partial [Bacteroidales bacterium]|nr:UvrD-helicase domain-containing protein [Bacteroidales bacterium]